MDTSQIIVIVSGVGIIAFILWFFFGKPESKNAFLTADIQKVEIEVGYPVSPK
jgi:plastocyanin domain-containing protein